MIVLKEYDSIAEPVAVTIGKFDGFHIGHQKLLKTVTEHKELKSLVIIIRDANDNAVFGNDEIQEYLNDFRIDYVCWLEFDENIRNIKADEFIHILCLKYRIRLFVIGEDFRFGKDALGDSSLIINMSKKYMYDVTVCDFEYYHDLRISSSLIRKLLLSGDIPTVNSLLGHNYYIRGKVAKGNGIGNTIGYPTANISKYKIFPGNGVYYTKSLINNTQYDSITNIGTKPTVSDENIVNAETHIFNYSGDLYNCIITIEFIKLIRKEKKFSSVELLAEQIHNDILAIKNFK